MVLQIHQHIVRHLLIWELVVLFRLQILLRNGTIVLHAQEAESVIVAMELVKIVIPKMVDVGFAEEMVVV